MRFFSQRPGRTYRQFRRFSQQQKMTIELQVINEIGFQGTKKATNRSFTSLKFKRSSEMKTMEERKEKLGNVQQPQDRN